MVRIVNFKERVTENRTFYVLELHGGVEMVKNENTGQYFATSKKAFVSSTFDKSACELLIGSELDGEIHKVPCKPYEYFSKKTGEKMILDHTYVFIPANSQDNENADVEETLELAEI